MKKITILAFLILIWFTSTTCKKKISKYPDNLYGVWTCNHPCDWMLLTIEKNGDGHYGPRIGWKGCNMSVDGKVRFNTSALFVGGVKLSFKSKPELLDSSTVAYFAYEKVEHWAKYRNQTNPPDYTGSKVYATMTITESELRGGGEYTLYKTRNY